MFEDSRGTSHELAEPVPGTQTSLEVTRGLLGSIVGGLLNLLLGGGWADVTITAVHKSGWRSETSAPLRIERRSVLIIGTGVGCA